MKMSMENIIPEENKSCSFSKEHLETIQRILKENGELSLSELKNCLKEYEKQHIEDSNFFKEAIDKVTQYLEGQSVIVDKVIKNLEGLVSNQKDLELSFMKNTIEENDNFQVIFNAMITIQEFMKKKTDKPSPAILVYKRDLTALKESYKFAIVLKGFFSKGFYYKTDAGEWVKIL